MAYVWTKNVTWTGATNPGGATAIFALKQALSSSGWAVPTWSNGISVSTDGAQLNNMNLITASLSWVRMQMPSSSREFVFQRTSAGAGSENQWRVKYVASGGFVGGAATLTPSSTLDCYLCGGGTDTTPTFGNLFGYSANAATTFVSHILVDNSAPYGFCMWGYNIAVSPAIPTVRIFCDPLLSGTYPNADLDPYVLCCEKGSSQFGWGTSADPIKFGLTSELNHNGMVALLSSSLTGANYNGVSIPLYTHFNSQATTFEFATDRIGTDPFSTKDLAPRAIYTRRQGAAGGALSGYKGISSLFRVGYPNRSIGETFTYSTNRDYIRIGSILIPWDGTLGFT
jgi:hypothetical protein